MKTSMEEIKAIESVLKYLMYEEEQIDFIIGMFVMGGIKRV